MNRFGKGFFPAVHRLSSRGKASQELGELGEAMARALLARQGVKRIERIHTGWKVTWEVKGGKRVVKNAFPLEKVSGDFIGIMNGLKVLVECKATEEDRIVHSKLEKHQVENLDRTVAHRGVGFLFVMIKGDPFLLRWPVEGFTAGTSIVLTKGKLVLRGGK